jgi:hypothetical protein
LNKKSGDVINVEDFIAIAECLEMLHPKKEKFVFR